MFTVIGDVSYRYATETADIRPAICRAALYYNLYPMVYTAALLCDARAHLHLIN